MTIKDKITELLKQSGKSLKTDLLPHIEMTEQGYYSTFRNDSLKVSTLIKISEFFNIPVSNFFLVQTKKTDSRAKVQFELSPDDILNIDMKARKLEITKRKH